MLNYKEYGSGAPLLILHGLFGMLDNWQTLGKAFAEDFRTFLIDQRNHGRSPHFPTISYPEMAKDLLGFTAEKGITKSHLLGHSMGGKTAMQFALDYPEQVAKLIVVDMTPRQYPGGHEIILEALQSTEPQQAESRSEVEAQLAHFIDDRGIRLFLLKNLSRKKEGGYQWKMNLDAIAKDYEKILAPIEGPAPFEGPALFVKGGKSQYVRDEDKTLIEHWFPRAEIVSVADAGHWVHAEQPDALQALVKEFLSTGRKSSGSILETG